MGQRVALAERELDQAQYDRLSDVLAVGEAGMLIHADTLRSIGGFDAALPGLDAGLDLCVRVRLQGHRIVVVPRAVVDVGSSSVDWNAGKKLPATTHDYLSLRAWLYRRLVYTSLWAFLPLLLAMLPWSIIRAAGQLVAKRPDRMFSEVSAALAVLGQLPSVLSARKNLNDARTTSWEAIDALRMSSRDVAKKRAIAREEKWAKREEQEGAEPSPRALPQLPWLALALVAVAGAVFGPWWGSTALIGGGALPLAATIQDAWAQAWSVIPTQWGFDASALPADPAALLFALLGSLTWWAPSTSVVYLFGVAIPLAGVIAWWGFLPISFRQSFVTTLSALLWALSPTFLVAISEGRIGAVMAHLALPLASRFAPQCPPIVAKSGDSLLSRSCGHCQRTGAIPRCHPWGGRVGHHPRLGQAAGHVHRGSAFCVDSLAVACSTAFLLLVEPRKRRMVGKLGGFYSPIPVSQRVILWHRGGR